MNQIISHNLPKYLERTQNRNSNKQRGLHVNQDSCSTKAATQQPVSETIKNYSIL